MQDVIFYCNNLRDDPRRIEKELARTRIDIALYFALHAME